MRLSAIALATLLGLSLLPTQATARPSDQNWQLIMAPKDAVVVATGRAKKNFHVVELQTFTLLPAPLDEGGDGIYSRFEIDCDWGRIRDIGSTAYAGTRPLHALGSQTGGEFVAPKNSDFYAGVRSYACGMVPPVGLYRRFTSLDSVVRDARDFMKHFD